MVSLLLVSRGVAPAWSLLFNAALLGLAVIFERRGYHPRAPDPTALHPTNERFKDPTSGEIIEVWEDPKTGSREYRPISR